MGTVPESVIDLLESLAYESVGMTHLALVRSDVPFDLTISQWRVLVETGRHPALRMGELSRRLGVSLPSTTRLIGRLERAGLVRTERSATDRRVVLVSITSEGDQVRSGVAAYRRDLIETALAGRTLPKGAPSTLMSIVDALDSYR